MFITDLECKLKPLLKELRPIAADYNALGIQLGILPDKIKEFETETCGQDVNRYLHEVLYRWLQEGDCKLDTLVNGLMEISHRRLAEKLKEDYKGTFVCLGCWYMWSVNHLHMQKKNCPIDARLHYLK